MTREWRVHLPMTRPLSMNDRMHHMVKARARRRVRDITAQLVRDAGVPSVARVSITLHYIPRDRRRRDPLNLVETLKPCEDAVVDAGVIPDDTFEFSEPTMPVIDPPDADPLTHRLYLVIRELEALP